MTKVTTSRHMHDTIGILLGGSPRAAPPLYQYQTLASYTKQPFQSWQQ